MSSPQRTKTTNKAPDAEEIEKKLQLSLGLFEAAFEIKRRLLREQFPEKSENDIRHMTMRLFEKGGT